MSQFAMVFPGQGSQTPGMLKALAETYPLVESIFCEASDVLGYDLWQLVQHGPAEELNKTRQTQPALLAASVAIFRIWRQQNGVMPAMMAGHSLGEYSALVCAGSLNFADGIKLVELRGRLMQEAVPEGTGAMQAIIGLEDAVVVEACNRAAQGGTVCAVNFNSPGQVVIAGDKEAVQRAGGACRIAGAAKVFSLPVSVPSHSPLMRPAAEKLASVLEKVSLSQPIVPIVNNVDVRCEIDPEMIRNALVRQLCSPVRWTECVRFLTEQGISMLLEVGLGRVLTGLSKRIINTLSVSAVNDPDSLLTALRQQT